MKKNKIFRSLTFLCLLAMLAFSAIAADPGRLFLSVKYFSYNNEIPFVRIQTKTKVEKKLQAAGNVEVNLFLDDMEEGSSIGKVKTNLLGLATIPIPEKLKEKWDASSTHTIYANTAASKAFDEAEEEIQVTKASLVLDTLNDGETKSITATLMEWNGDSWSPVPDVDVIIGVKRMGGILSAGSDLTYTTNEEGVAEAYLEKENLPGDNKGTLKLVAKVEDNDIYGNLVTEIKAPWGKPTITEDEGFYKRSLWAISYRAPIWLILIANSIIIAVWGILIYLLVQIYKIRKIGIEKT